MLRRRRFNRAFVAGCVALAGAWTLSLQARQQITLPDLPRPLQSLRGHVPPEPPNLDEFVRDRNAAILLGKALFWDMQAGSDEQTACGTCHFAAGHDARVRNRVHPGVDAFNPLQAPAGAQAVPHGANAPLNPDNFPFHVLADPEDRDSIVLFSSNDVVGSQGVFRYKFGGIGADGKEILTPLQSDVFRVGASPNRAQVRQVTGRQAPSVINAAFNHRNFWDGRANNIFNGVNHLGPRDPAAVVWVSSFNGECWLLVPEKVALINSAAASQSVVPPLSDAEMSAAGRTFPDIGRKLLPRRALALQAVDPTDSVLGAYAVAGGTGLSVTYRQLVEQAFWPKWWNSDFKVPGTNYSHMEGNFSLFWGIAIQMYESTLVSDDAPIDRFLTGLGSLTADEMAGMEVFTSKGCSICHGGPEFTTAGRIQFINEQVGGLMEQMQFADGGVGLYDASFYNIGVRPTAEDLLLGAGDPFGNPLSFARQAKLVMQGGTAVDPFHVDTCSFEVGTCEPLVNANIRDGVDGSVKTPGLRNVELTGPYFHNGSYRTLEEVVEFYSRGGNARRLAAGGDTTGFGPNPSNLAFDMVPLGFTLEQERQLVAFMKALTDPRVRNEAAPFDHPEIRIPDGHYGDATSTPIDGSGRAIDRWYHVPAVGALGRPAASLPPLDAWALPPAKVNAPGLVAAFSFDDPMSPALDDSVKENHGVLDGALWTWTGKYGGALSFQGSAMVSVLSSASLTVTNRFTMSAWVNPSVSTDWRTVMLKEHSTGLAYALYSSTDTRVPAAYARINKTFLDQPVAGPAALPTGAWTHLAATYDGATFRLFVNGAQVRSTGLKGSLVTSTSQFRIGGNKFWGEYFQGLIDEVRIYDRALTAGEIALDMQTPIR